MSFWIAHTKATGLAVALENRDTLSDTVHCRRLSLSPLYPLITRALQGESTRRFDFRNTADTPETIDTLRLGPYLQPFSLHSPLPRVPRAPWGTRVLLVARTTPSCNVAAPFRSCPYHNHRLALFLPRFYPTFTLMAPITPFLPRFYPGFTLFWRGKLCRGKTEGKNGVNSLYPGVKRPFLLVTDMDGILNFRSRKR